MGLFAARSLIFLIFVRWRARRTTKPNHGSRPSDIDYRSSILVALGPGDISSKTSRRRLDIYQGGRIPFCRSSTYYYLFISIYNISPNVSIGGSILANIRRRRRKTCRPPELGGDEECCQFLVLRRLTCAGSGLVALPRPASAGFHPGGRQVVRSGGSNQARFKLLEGRRLGRSLADTADAAAETAGAAAGTHGETRRRKSITRFGGAGRCKWRT